jgi:anti-sigma factor RsiW
MTNDKPLSDDDLHAYVDGLLNDARRAIVDAYLEQNALQKHRVDGWISQKVRLQSAFASVADEPLPPELTMRHLVEEQRQHRLFSWFDGNLRVAAGLVLALGVGASSGWFGRAGLITHKRAQPETGIAALKLETNAAYRIFAQSPPLPCVAQQGVVPASTRALWRAVGRKFAIPNLTAAGYAVERIEWVATIHGPAAVVMYRARDNRKLMLLVRKMDVPASSDRMSEAHGDGRSLFTWISHGIGFAVASGGAPDKLHRIANKIRADERLL